MDEPVYVEYEYEDDDNSNDVEYADYYEDDSLQIPDDIYSSDDQTEPIPSMTLDELYKYCIVPTITDSYRHLVMILSFSMLFLISSRIIRLPSFLVHFSSAAFGIALVWQMFHIRCYYLAILFFSTYFTLCSVHYGLQTVRGPATCILGILYLVSCEFWFVEPIWWHAMRGIQMVILMKMVSVGYDLDMDKLKKIPNFLEMAGYIFNPGSIIFGPWMSFTKYKSVLLPMKWSLRWALSLVIGCLATWSCLIFSTCFVNWIIQDDSNKWLISYRDALSFRSSHYFVSYLSEMSSNLAGIGIDSVSKPYYIEMPRSLIEVVVYWNIPMHHWLKNYIFKPVHKKLGVFCAISITYGMSAMFHGLNFQLGAILLSLGFYTYTEHTLRTKLSKLFDACIMARPCNACNHRRKGSSFFSKSMNLLFGLVAMYHLAYLGMMFDSSHIMQEKGYSMSHTLRKWGSFDYISHWLSLVMYIVMAVL